MLYPAALTSALLSPAVKALDYTPASGETPASGARVVLGEMAEAQLRATEPAYAGTKGLVAAGIVMALMNHLMAAGFFARDEAASAIASWTTGAESQSYQRDVAMVPPALQQQWDALADPAPPAAASAANSYLVVRSLR